MLAWNGVKLLNCGGCLVDLLVIGPEQDPKGGKNDSWVVRTTSNQISFLPGIYMIDEIAIELYLADVIIFAQDPSNWARPFPFPLCFPPPLPYEPHDHADSRVLRLRYGAQRAVATLLLLTVI